MNEDLTDFISALKNVKKQPKGLVNLGLIVAESKSKTESEKLLKEIKKLEKIDSIVFDKKCSDENLIQKIAECFKDGKWLFVEVKKDINGATLSQLKRISDYNTLQITDEKKQDLSELEMPESSRIILFAERNFIEKNITYPYFYNIFGLVLSLN